MSGGVAQEGGGSDSCIFCRVVAGQIPCYKLYEDDTVLAFLDIGPLSPGHCLIIPKPHYATLDRVPESLAGDCARLLPRLAAAVMRATGAKGWNVLQNNGAVAGQEVGHVHFHIIPRGDGDGLGYRWPAGKLEGDEAETLVTRITSHL